MVDVKIKCPDCADITLAFIGTVRTTVHGPCKYWKCPGCGKIFTSDESGVLI